jgi:hypothetical protein
VNEIVALCDLGASVSTILKSLFQRLNLGSFEVTELKLYLTDSTYKQVVGIKHKHNVLVQVKGCHALIDRVVADIPKYSIAPIILGIPFLRMVKSLINLQDRNVRFELPSRKPFGVHFLRKKKNKRHDDEIITLNANHFVVGIPLARPK